MDLQDMVIYYNARNNYQNLLLLEKLLIVFKLIIQKLINPL